MAKRIKIGPAHLPVYALTGYALSGVMLLVSATMYSADPLGWYAFVGRLSVTALIIGGIVHLFDKVDRCVGKVWEAGGRAERRRAEVEAATQADELASVHTLAPRP